MARLPIPGSDDDTWGGILNDFLAQAHNSDGTLKAGIVSAANLQNDSVTATQLAVSGGNDGQVLTHASGQSGGLSWTTVSGSAGPATGSSLGTVQLAGDLSGTATAPTVPGLTTKANSSTTITAGTGLTGGGDLSANRTLSANFGTSAGTIAQGNDSRIANAIQASTVTATGDLLVGVSAGTIARLGVGADGNVLTAASAQPGGMQWVAPNQTQTVDWVNVKLAPYNAAGNGTTDDTTAIQNAITAAMSGSTKKAVFFPAGTYKMTQGIVLQTGLTLIGEALSEKEFQYRVTITNTTTDTFTWGGGGATDSSQRPKDMILRGICFSGSNGGTNFITPVAMNASGAYPSHLVIEECGIHNYILVYSGAAQALTIKDCYLNNTSATSLNLGGSDNYIMRNFIDGYIAGSQSGSTMVFLQCQESVFSQNYVTCSPAMGVEVGNWSVGLRITNNQINGLAQSASHGGGNYADGPGIYVAPGARGVVIDGNAIANVCANPWGVMDSAITIVDAADITVTNNIIDSLQNAGGKHLRITQSSNTVNRIKVSGNTYTSGQSADVSPKVVMTGTTSNVILDEWGAVSQAIAGVPSDTNFVVTPPDGTLATDTVSKTLYVRSGGTWTAITGGGGGSGGVSAVTGINSVVNITGSTETLIAQSTIPGNTTVAGDTYRVIIGGTMDCGTTADTITIYIRVGGVGGTQVGGLQWTMNTTTKTGGPFWAMFEVAFQGAASSSTPVVSTEHGYGTSSGSSGVVSASGVVNFTSATANMTTDQQLAVSAKFSAADAAQALHVNVLTIDKMR